MRIGTIETDCTTAEWTDTFDNAHTITFSLPRPGFSTEQNIVSSSAAFITTPVYGCTQTYSLEMEDNTQSVPDYYHLNSATGELTFTNSPYRFVDDRIKIVVSSTDGVTERLFTPFLYPHIQTSQIINVKTSCG